MMEMVKLELFFDYACPYCYRGHKNLLNLLGRYPQIELVWRPCESHPRPEPSPVHSDKAIQGMYYIQEHQGDLWRYHALAYEAVFDRGLDISSMEVLSQMASRCRVDPVDFQKMVGAGHYRKQLVEGNRYAWETNRLDAVPSYRSGKHFIGSKDGLLVPAKRLEAFLDGLVG
ncbi:DsbA family protein [Lachnoclostridium pacaense]|uniref:DsbA family oxidoreductase n=1 Tax=Enterocloster hominis (ex Hitch et al. 2024) TaxID=1917870 RepID=UPI001D0F5CF5|nr:DsbA family protein [Lachnoclostridium pacaense]MCC2816446.1 DsbA family protein [Lachnoclostridium pacaense]